MRLYRTRHWRPPPVCQGAIPLDKQSQFLNVEATVQQINLGGPPVGQQDVNWQLTIHDGLPPFTLSYSMNWPDSLDDFTFTAFSENPTGVTHRYPTTQRWAQVLVTRNPPTYPVLLYRLPISQTP